MNRAWNFKKKSIAESLARHHRDSPVCKILSQIDLGEEIRAVVGFLTRTVIKRQDGTITTSGPVVTGVRYHERFLSEAPHPLEIATILTPREIYHPNCVPSGGICLGTPTPGLSIDTILYQLWCGVNFNMRFVNTDFRRYFNFEAAAHARAHAAEYPLTRTGLFEHPDPKWIEGLQLPAWPWMDLMAVDSAKPDPELIDD